MKKLYELGNSPCSFVVGSSTYVEEEFWSYAPVLVGDISDEANDGLYVASFACGSAVSIDVIRRFILTGEKPVVEKRRWVSKPLTYKLGVCIPHTNV